MNEVLDRSTLVLYYRARLGCDGVSPYQERLYIAVAQPVFARGQRVSIIRNQGVSAIKRHDKTTGKSFVQGETTEGPFLLDVWRYEKSLTHRAE